MNDTTDAPGSQGPAGTPSSGPRVDRDQVRDLGRLSRPHDRRVAGVASGLARHLDVDPLVLRIAFVVLVLFGGAGLLLYGALWLLLPDDGAERAPLQLDERSRGIAVIGAGVLAGLLVLGDSWNLYWFPWPLALAALAVWWFFFRDSGDSPQAPPPGTPYGAAPATQHATYSGTYAVPPLPPRPSYARPRDARKRGPRLFWFTLALVALALGTLGIVDLAGAPVSDSAYAALSLGIVGAMLVLGAFWGRAGGLVLLGLLASVGLVGSLTAQELDGDDEVVTPRSAAEVRGNYEMGAGTLRLDLREVRDPAELDGREVQVSGGIGRIEVLLPDDLGAVAFAEVGGPGRVALFDSVDRGGIATSADASTGVGEDLPVVNLDLDLGVGEIVVTSEGETR